MKRKKLYAMPLMGVLLILFTCSGVSEEDLPLKSDENGISVAASFHQESGIALCGGIVRISSEEQSVDCTLDSDGQTIVSGLPRNGTVALTVLDQQEQLQGAMSLSFTQGAVIDATTDEGGAGHVSLRKDTEEIALMFLLKGDGTLQCALQLTQPGFVCP